MKDCDGVAAWHIRRTVVANVDLERQTHQPGNPATHYSSAGLGQADARRRYPEIANPDLNRRALKSGNPAPRYPGAATRNTRRPPNWMNCARPSMRGSTGKGTCISITPAAACTPNPSCTI